MIDSIVAVTSVDRALLTRNAYNLHAYHLTARMVADAVKRRFADFEFDFEPVDGVERLIKAWPDVSDDSDARRDWGWNPAYDFERTADKMFELVTS